jgi:protein-tyrosine-phosphatase
MLSNIPIFRAKACYHTPEESYMTQILIIGASDTGRAPIAVALLTRLITEQNLTWSVASAGILGHDGDPAQSEARHVSLHLGLNIDSHIARSISAEVLAAAGVLLALDSGVGRVVRERFPEAAPRLVTLGEIAGRKRDLPDPFRMQIGAWIAYAHEMNDLLRAAMPQLQNLVQLYPPAVGLTMPASESPMASSEAIATDQLDQPLWQAQSQTPATDWPATRDQIEQQLSSLTNPAPLTIAYVALLRAGIAVLSPTPTPAQVQALTEALQPLANGPTQEDVTRLSLAIGRWSTRA